MLWKQLDNYSRYEISDTGLVKNLRTNRLLKGSISQDYKIVTLYPDKGKKKPLRVHRVIAQIFCPNPENYKIVNHIDGDKLNNHAVNLEWTTSRKNTQHATKIGKMVITNYRRIRRICPKTKEFKDYESITEAFKDNKDVLKYDTYIINACAGKQKTSGNFIWEYIDKHEKHDIPEKGKVIKGFTKYLVTSDGKIYSKSCKRYLKPYKNRAGYLIIDLHGDNYDKNKDHDSYTRKRISKRKKFRVHRLVAKYFIHNENPELYVEINHKNKDRTDNRVENLEWVTGKQNLQHAHNKKIEQYSKDGTLICVYNSMKEAGKNTGINHKNISSCVRKGWKHTAGGFKWKYQSGKI